MVDRRGVLARLPIGRTIRLVLLGLTVLLAVVAGLAIGNLYEARQHYEDRLARAYDLEAASARLLAVGVVEEAARAAPAKGKRGRAVRRTRRRAAQVFDAQARRALVLAEGDRESVRLVRARIAAQRSSRRGGGRTRAARVARRADEALVARQERLRKDAREEAREDSRDALLTAGVAGGLAILAVLLFVGGLIASIRRPLDALVGATRRLAEGDLRSRVEPGGPAELAALGDSFNAMAEQLDAAHRRIDEERRKLAGTIESLGDALVVCDGDGVVTAVNPRAREVAPWLEPGAAAQPGTLLPPLEEALQGEVMRRDGDRTYAITAARLGEGGSEGAVWTIRDVSERARLERMKSDFVATASHELRSPLTSIKGFVELLARSDGLGAREREFVDVVLQSTDRLVDLVNDLLDVARLEAGKMDVHPRLFDLGEVVREAATLIRPRLDAKRQTLELETPPGLPRVLADPARARQIVTNLLSNAHQYTPEGGRLGVRLHEDRGSLVMTVSDDGRGMTPEEAERAFERFVRGEDAGRGTGLGLSIVKSLVELQRGSIELESAPTEGTTVTVRLPAEPLRATDGEIRAAIRGKRVLVVDDEPDVARLIAEQLRTFEVDAEVAHGGDEAIDRLHGGHFDAVTLDILMPGRSGIEVLKTLRADPELRRLPVVVVSVVSGNDALLGEWKVAKPVDPEELADALGSAVMSGRTRVLVVGRSTVRSRLEPALVELGLEHEWVTSGAAAARACAERRFEVALVDAGMRNPDAVVQGLQLRGRRVGRAVVLFSEGEEVAGVANLGAEAVPIEEAASTLLQTLSEQGR